MVAWTDQALEVELFEPRAGVSDVARGVVSRYALEGRNHVIIVPAGIVIRHEEEGLGDVAAGRG